MAFKLLDGATAIGASRAILVRNRVEDHTIEAWFRSLAATPISALTIVLQGALEDEGGATGVITNPNLAVGSTAEQVKTDTFYYRIADTNYAKTTVAAGETFTAAHVVSATKFGVILMYIDASGTLVSQVPLATQEYDTAAEAHAAADAWHAGHYFASLCYIGRILINADAGDWTANTDDLTDASDLTTATFLSETSNFYDLATHAFTAGEITAQRAMFHVSDKSVKYVRLFISELTGTGEISARYAPVIQGE